MRLGDYISVDDYDAIWGEPKRSRIPSLIERLMMWVIVIGVGGALAFVQGCDGPAAEHVEIAKAEALAKKEAVMGMPCTWVAQCGRPISDCPVEARKCVNSDLRY